MATRSSLCTFRVAPSARCLCGRRASRSLFTLTPAILPSGVRTCYILTLQKAKRLLQTHRSGHRPCISFVTFSDTHFLGRISSKASHLGRIPNGVILYNLSAHVQRAALPFEFSPSQCLTMVQIFTSTSLLSTIDGFGRQQPSLWSAKRSV
jgi:hypothetical protein